MKALIGASPVRQAFSFIALAYLLSWGIGLLTRGEPSGALSPLFIGGVSLAAVIVAAVTQGRAGLGDLFRRLLIWRVAPRWYVFVLGAPVAIVLLALALNTALGGSQPDWSKTFGLGKAALLLTIFLFVPLGAPLGEEIGWRGYALPRLLARFSPFTASLILGFAWALWHLPLLIIDPSLRPPLPFTLQVVSFSILYSWVLMNTRGSLLMAVMFHASFDLVLMWAAGTVLPADHQRLWWIIATSGSAAAAAIVLFDRARWFARPDPTQAPPYAVSLAAR